MHEHKERGNVFYGFNMKGHDYNFEVGIITVNKQDYQQGWQRLLAICDCTKLILNKHFKLKPV